MNVTNAATNCIEILLTKIPTLTPKRNKDNPTELSHTLWLLMGITAGYIEGEKAHRWLGWAQNTLVSNNIITLNEAMLINKES